MSLYISGPCAVPCRRIPFYLIKGAVVREHGNHIVDILCSKVFPHNFPVVEHLCRKIPYLGFRSVVKDFSVISRSGIDIDLVHLLTEGSHLFPVGTVEGKGVLPRGILLVRSAFRGFIQAYYHEPLGFAHRSMNFLGTSRIVRVKRHTLLVFRCFHFRFNIAFDGGVKIPLTRIEIRKCFLVFIFRPAVDRHDIEGPFTLKEVPQCSFLVIISP